MNEMPQAELQIMMIIWEFNRPVTRVEIEKKLAMQGRILNKTSILTYLSRLQSRGFIEITREGKNNIFTPVISEQEYVKEEGKKIINQMYRGSVKNFVCALYDGGGINKKDLDELRDYINNKI